MSQVEGHALELYNRLFNSLKQSPGFLKQLKCNENSGASRDANQQLGNWFLEELKKLPNLRINIRGRRAINTKSLKSQSQYYRVCIDPLDGASHYYQRGHTSGLSHAACVTVLKKNNKISRFSDIVAGGIVELRTGDMWTATMTSPATAKKESQFQALVNSKPFKVLSHTKLDLRTMTIFASMHNAEDRDRIQHAFGKDYGMIRTHGSVASEIAYVASGQAIACISSGQSHYSQGAGFPLLLAGGGVTVNLNGGEIINDPFDLREKTPVLFAANMSIAEQILEKLHR